MPDYKKPPRPKNALDHRKLYLVTPTPGFENATGRDRKTATLSLNIFQNNPRITVWTGDPNDTGEQNGYGKIQANITTPVFMQMMAMLRLAAEGPADKKYSIQNKNFTYYGGKRSDRPEVVSTTWIGKDKEGVVFISVTAPMNKKRPLIKFKFIMDEFHEFQEAGGAPMGEAEFSVISAISYADMMTGIMLNMIPVHYEEPPPRDPPGGQNNNRGNYGGGRTGGSGGAGPSDVEEDIPF